MFLTASVFSTKSRIRFLITPFLMTLDDVPYSDFGVNIAALAFEDARTEPE
jgi:hypothetical protein